MTVELDLEVQQGATYRRSFVWKDSNGDPVDLTGYIARMQIRRRKSAPVIEHSATTENGGITITPLEGRIDLLISATATAAFDFTSGAYDLELVASDNDVTRFLEGAVSVSKEVTR